MERGCRQNDSLTDGYHERHCCLAEQNDGIGVAEQMTHNVGDNSENAADAVKCLEGDCVIRKPEANAPADARI